MNGEAELDELLSIKESRVRRTGPKVRRTPKHYGELGGEHRPDRGYRRPQHVRWEDHND